MIKIETNAEYHANPAISKSRLAKIGICPQYYKWAMDNPQPKTDELIFGSAFHKWILEKDDFYNEFTVIPKLNKRTNAGKAEYDRLLSEAEAENKEIINEETFEMIKEMESAILENPATNKLLKGNHENSIYYTDDFSGIDCKCRPDSFRQIGDRIICVDLKTTSDSSPLACQKAIVKYGYDLQAYMYTYGLSKEFNVPTENIDFVFVFVEKKAPYLSYFVQADNYILQRGENIFREYLGILKYCNETQNWYGYNGASAQIATISLPNYLIKEIKGDIE